MLNLNKRTKKNKSDPNQHSSLRTAHIVCEYRYAQLSYTTQHRTVLNDIFPIIPIIHQRIIIAQMVMSISHLCGYSCGIIAQQTVQQNPQQIDSRKLVHNKSTTNIQLIEQA